MAHSNLHLLVQETRPAITGRERACTAPLREVAALRATRWRPMMWPPAIKAAAPRETSAHPRSTTQMRRLPSRSGGAAKRSPRLSHVSKTWMPAVSARMTPSYAIEAAALRERFAHPSSTTQRRRLPSRSGAAKRSPRLSHVSKTRLPLRVSSQRTTD